MDKSPIQFACLTVFLVTLVMGALVNDASAQRFRSQRRFFPPVNQPTYQGQNFSNVPAGNIRPQPGQTMNASATTTSNRTTNLYWTQSFEFAAKDHDFGAVPMASKQEHVFEFKNTLNEPIHLTGVRASCGCTIPTILTPIVNPGEVAKVKAKYDTLSHRGVKSATVTLSVRRDAPVSQFGEVQFSVRGKIRQDVVLNPGQISFDNVPAAMPHQRRVRVDYAGNWQWKIMDVKSTNPNLTATFVEAGRDPATGRVGYHLDVTLNGQQKDGMFSDTLTLVTNDGVGGTMDVAVEGRVKPMIETSPINLGTIQAGTKISKRVVLKGAAPFEIESIGSPDNRIKVSPSSGMKKLHIVSYELDTSTPGNVEGEIVVSTSLGSGHQMSIPFSAQIVEPATQ